MNQTGADRNPTCRAPHHNMGRSKFHAHINWQDAYTHPIIISALSSAVPSCNYTLVDSVDELPSLQSPFLQITSYETIPFEHLLEHPSTSLVCSYIIRKALIRKHYLAHTVHSYLAKHPESALKDHVPLTVDIEVDYAEFLDEALVEAYELHEAFARNEGNPPADREWWILKPSMSDRGQGIRLFSTGEELHDIFQQWEQDQSGSEDDDEGSRENEPNETDPSGRITAKAAAQSPEAERPSKGIITSQLRHFVAQPYIPPLLLPKYENRKFHIRTYVLCVGALRVYVYKEMLALFAAVPYQPPGALIRQSSSDTIEASSLAVIDMLPHLTNTCLQTDPSPLDANSLGPSVIPLHALSASALTPLTLSSIHSQIFTTTSHVFRAAVAQPTTFQPLPNAFEIFGVDWLVDPECKVHLLEFNAYPDFAQSGMEGKKVVEGLWRGVLEVVLKGDGDGGEGFFGELKNEGGEGNAGEVERGWGLEKVLDLDMGRR